MDGGPGEPGEQTVHLKLAALQNGVAFADYRHVTFVEVTKRFEASSSQQYAG